MNFDKGYWGTTVGQNTEMLRNKMRKRQARENLGILVRSSRDLAEQY